MIRPLLYNIFFEKCNLKNSSESHTELKRQARSNSDKIELMLERLNNKDLSKDELYIVYSYYVFQLWYNKYYK